MGSEDISRPLHGREPSVRISNDVGDETSFPQPERNKPRDKISRRLRSTTKTQLKFAIQK